MDFTRIIYTKLLKTVASKNYKYLTFKEYLSSQKNVEKGIILRHDVDRNPINAIHLAKLEKSIGIIGTYYFRVVPESYDLEIMKKIVGLGHEIGYHYEDADIVYKKYSKKDVRRFEDELRQTRENKYSAPEWLIDAAYESFYKNLEMLRKDFDIKTICMHGSPRAKYDNKIIWERYNYKDLGIVGEPYFDIDFNEFAYFTDTGRKWNGHKYSVRDKVNSKYYFDFKTTQEIIDTIDKLPSKVMFTIHPERWHDSFIPWTKELVWQNIKNVVKRGVVYYNNKVRG